jgi:hypothetical protein
MAKTDLYQVLPQRSNVETTAQYLKRLEESGFLFHGSESAKVISKIEPRPAYDPNSSWNTDTTVFATNKAVWSVIFAIYKGEDAWSTDLNVHDDSFELVARINPKYKTQLPLWTGHVYILPADSFEQDPEGGIQFKSKREVIPLGYVGVTYQDYLDMGGKIRWQKVDLEPPEVS